MSDISKKLVELEDEARALKNAYQQTALQLPVFTYSIEYITSVNTITITSWGESYSFDGGQRVVLTFVSVYGVNALATLEVSWDDGSANSGYKVRRVPYSGGARWIVYNYPMSGTINYTFTVHSSVKGTLGAKMIWQ